jgi:NAD(P)H dehydrogenase (quinone)
VTGRPAEDFATIARRYAALSSIQRTLGNWLRHFAQSFQKNHINN